MVYVILRLVFLPDEDLVHPVDEDPSDPEAGGTFIFFRQM
jgi:hypothetical protein